MSIILIFYLFFSVFHLGLLFLLYQISIIPSENIANVFIAMLGLLLMLIFLTTEKGG